MGTMTLANMDDHILCTSFSPARCRPKKKKTVASRLPQRAKAGACVMLVVGYIARPDQTRDRTIVWYELEREERKLVEEGIRVFFGPVCRSMASSRNFGCEPSSGCRDASGICKAGQKTKRRQTLPSRLNKPAVGG